MFYGASPEIFHKARLLRNNETKAEAYLWEKLSANKLAGFRFKRQHPISHYIVDFYCHKAKLVIEIDEPYHNAPNQKSMDENRTYVLKEFGLHVMRFSDSSVLNEIDSVLEEIRKFLQEASS